MTIIVTNQKPAVLDPVHLISCKGDFDPMPAISAVIADPIRTPLTAHSPASIVDGAGNDISADIETLLLSCLGETVQPQAEQTMKELLGQTLVNYDQATTLPVGELFAAQAGRTLKLPTPSPTVIYNARDDVIPAAKALLSSTDGNQFFTAIAFAFHPNTLGFWFQSEAAFDDFKAWLRVQTQTMATALPGTTTQLLGDFDHLSLKGLTESLQLRVDDTDGNDEFSFARFIVHMLMSYTQQLRTQAQSQGLPGSDQIGVMPFSVGELFCPRSLVLVNVDAHARASAAKVTAEWKLINTSIASPLKMVSNQNLTQLTAMHRASARARLQAVASNSPNKQTGRSGKVVFRKRPPSKVNLAGALHRVLMRMGKVNRSQNIFRKSKTTFLKTNRRDPDDYNKPGRITSISYMPDLHVYVDTSGSISEANYQEAVMMLIAIAKKLNVNLYFNSFSHVLSQETLLKVANKSTAQIWSEFRKVPKVTGGTDYLQIWRYINASTRRKRRLSLVITDFEWYPPSTREDHPANLYYAPCGAMDWDYLVQCAKSFNRSMHHIEPAIAQRLLGIIV